MGTKFSIPQLSEVSKRVGQASGRVAVVFAVNKLLGGVDYVLDPANNRVVYKQKEADGKNCTAWHGEKKFTGDLKSVGHQWCQAIRDYNNPADSFDKISHIQYWVGCKGGAGSVIVYCELGEGYVSFQDIAQQIIQNAKAGHADSIAFLALVATDIAKQDKAKPKPTPKPIASTNANEDTDTSNSDKEKDDKPEPPKTCGMVYPNMPQCKYQDSRLIYSSKQQALASRGWTNYSLESKQNSYKGNCKGYSEHWNIRNPKAGNKRVASLVSCKCCEDRYDKQPKLKTIFGVI